MMTWPELRGIRSIITIIIKAAHKGANRHWPLCTGMPALPPICSSWSPHDLSSFHGPRSSSHVHVQHCRPCSSLDYARVRRTSPAPIAVAAYSIPSLLPFTSLPPSLLPCAAGQAHYFYSPALGINLRSLLLVLDAVATAAAVPLLLLLPLQVQHDVAGRGHCSKVSSA